MHTCSEGTDPPYGAMVDLVRGIQARTRPELRRRVGVRTPAPPLHPFRLIEQPFRVREPRLPQKLHDVLVVVREPGDLTLDGDPPPARPWARAGE
uniref:Uncharacterized protein n=1 Tax=Streptomyces pratensis (strain ATCC 33331 / IAF-45CD) TaxID=591167 RepID=A0A8D4BDT8_STRFA